MSQLVQQSSRRMATLTASSESANLIQNVTNSYGEPLREVGLVGALFRDKTMTSLYDDVHYVEPYRVDVRK